jgi:trk system potassium uptake protein TrkA
MKAVILGCGRVGAMLARHLAEQKWEVTAVDSDAEAFANLGDDFPGRQVSGSITEEGTLRAAGAEAADLIVVLTSDDIRNLMAAQIVRHKFGKELVFARVRDPIKAGAFRELGLRTICPSTVEFQMILKEIGVTAKG